VGGSDLETLVRLVQLAYLVVPAGVMAAFGAVVGRMRGPSTGRGALWGGVGGLGLGATALGLMALM
jgi:hypothetical protein